MNNLLDDIKSSLSKDICSSFSFYERQEKLYLINPFYFDDGDGIHIVIDSNGDKYTVSDQGNTLMRLSYDLSMSQLENGSRKEIVDFLKERYNVQDRIGEYRIETDRESLSSAIFDMIQFQTRMADIDYISRANNKNNTFIKDFKDDAQMHLENKVILDWVDEAHDEEGEYKVDVFIPGKYNLGLFPMHTNYNLLNNTVSILRLKEWHPDYKFIGVIDEEENVSNTNVSKFKDVAENVYFMNNTNTKNLFNHIYGLLGS